jgi:transaldolase
MNATAKLQHIGQSLWLDNISRNMIDTGQLETYIRDFSITGLTSNPSIFTKAITGGTDYDAQIAAERATGATPEEIVFRLMVKDLQRAADLFAPIHANTGGKDGWVSIEVSPHLLDDAKGSLQWAQTLHAQMNCPNAFVKIPGSPQGAIAIEEAIFQGIAINVTLLFSRDQYLVVAEAYMRGIERRILAGLDPKVRSVASVFVSRWDAAAAKQGRVDLRNKLGLAVAADVWDGYQGVLASERWKTLASAGAMPQTLLWASTGVKDPEADDTLYVSALAAPDTIDTMPDATLRAFADHGQVPDKVGLDRDAGAAVEQAATEGGLDVAALARQLQVEGGAAFVTAWDELIKRVEGKVTA